MLNQITVSDDVYVLRPDYVAFVMTVEGLPAGRSDSYSRSVLEDAQRTVTDLDDPHVTAWHEAYRAFGAKPGRTRPSVDALLRRAAGGLPEVNRVVDLYNAISVRYRVPVGGEDLDAYRGAARLVRARGDESFDTLAAGEGINDPPLPGEVVWRDDAGVTCRRWNWRQCVRTKLTEDTVNGFFVFDRLSPMSLEALAAAGEELVAHLTRLAPRARVHSRLLCRAG